MKSNTRTIDGVVILELAGRWGNVIEGLPIHREIERILAAGNRRILIDMDQVGFVDSSGLGELLTSKKAALGAGAQLKLLRPRDQFSVLLEHSSLGRLFECYGDEVSALRSFDA